jgi:hypothetical protein
MKGALFLDVVIRKSPSILKLLSSEDETLLIRRDSKYTVNTLLGRRQQGKRTPPYPGSWL